MCGLVGFTTHHKYHRKLSPEQITQRSNILKGLHLSMETRGTDSAGIATINETVHILKKAIASHKLMKDKAYNQLLKDNPRIVIGHTRLATTGLVTDDNAHPFLKGSIVGAHNGIVSNYLTINGKAQVDSEVIFELLDKNKNNFEKAFKKLSGSFAITWVDMNNPEEVFLTATDNPLAVAYVPSLKTIFWASEEFMLRIVLKSVGLKFQLSEAEDNTVYCIKKDLKITKHKIAFKEPDISWQKYTGNPYEDYDNYYSVDDEMMEALENYGCTSCLQPIDRAHGFYYHEQYGELYCNFCYEELLGTNPTMACYMSYIEPEEYKKIATKYKKQSRGQQQLLSLTEGEQILL